MDIAGIRKSKESGNSFSKLNSQADAFQSTLSRALAYQNSSRLPKMEFSGTLIPSQEAGLKRCFPYTLRTKMNKYRLQVDDALIGLAKGLEWKEVIVRGPFDFDAFAIEAEELKSFCVSSKLK